MKITDLMVDMHIRSSKLQFGKGLRSVLWGFKMFTKKFKGLKDKMLFTQGSLQTVLEGP